MPRNPKIWLGIITLLAAGCAQRQPAVFVDFEAVMRTEQLPRDPVVALPDVPTAMVPSSLILPPLPARTIDLESTGDELDRVAEIIESTRRQALREITRRLRDSYLQEVDALELERLASLDPAKADRFRGLMDAIRKEFEEYAAKRGPVLIELSVIVGFPDPDPNSQRPAADNPISRKNLARAKELRATLANLDAAYNQDVVALIARNDEFTASEITKIRTDMQELRANAEDKARIEAEKQVQLEQEQLSSIFQGGGQVKLPAQSAESVTVAGAAPVILPPAVTVPGEAELKDRMRNAIRTDAQIWAGMKGFKLVGKTSDGRDATSEFMDWRKINITGR